MKIIEILEVFGSLYLVYHDYFLNRLAQISWVYQDDARFEAYWFMVHGRIKMMQVLEQRGPDIALCDSSSLSVYNTV